MLGKILPPGSETSQWILNNTFCQSLELSFYLKGFENFSGGYADGQSPDRSVILGVALQVVDVDDAIVQFTAAPGHAAEVDLGHAHVDADAVLLRLRRLRHHREEYDGGAVVGRDHLGQGPSSLGVDRNHFSVEGSLVEFGGF